MKKILFISPNLCSGGAERQIVNVAILFKENGHDVEFLCYHKENFYEHLLKEKKIKINWIYLPNYIKRIIAVRRFIRNGNFDAVISFLNVASFLSNIASIGRRKFINITGERSAQEHLLTSKRGKIFGWFQRFSDFVVCNSGNARQMWIRYYPQYKDKLKVIYNIATIQPVTTNYVPKRDNKLHIIVAASYQYLKNPIGLIEALNLMTDEEKSRIQIDWYGRKEIVPGDSKAYNEASALIQKYHLGSVINLFDDTPKIHDKMNEADIVALFSRVEGLPNAICEGMTLGKPIIMTKVSDYNVLVDNSNGFLCDYNDYSSIKKAIIDASNLNKDDLRQKGLSSLSKAKNLFSKERVYDQWNELISYQSKTSNNRI